MPLNSHATFTVESAVELAVVERSGFVESRHIGSAVLIAGDGTVVTELGDITTPIYARSTLKPLHALDDVHVVKRADVAAAGDGRLCAAQGDAGLH